MSDRSSANLDALKKDIATAVPFTRNNLKYVTFEFDVSGKDGSCFEIVQKKNGEIVDALFKVTGTIDSFPDFSLTPKSVAATITTTYEVKIDKYRVKLVLDDEVNNDVESARDTLLDIFKSSGRAKRVALRHKIRKYADDWNKNPLSPTFPSLYQSNESSMTFTRPVSHRHGPVLPKNTLPYPAGIPKNDECEEAELKKGDKRYTLLPLIPVFELDQDGLLSLVDGRSIDATAKKKAEVVFPLKQTSYHFQSRQTGEIMERIAIDPSIICVFLLEDQKEQADDDIPDNLRRLKRRKQNTSY